LSDVILYTTEDGKTQIDLQLKDGTVWLSQQQIADLFQTSKQNISKHIKAIFEDQDLDERATVNQQLTVQIAISLDQVEKDYLNTISSLEKQTKKEIRKKGDQA
jgi:hypothetical protein